MRLAVKIFSVTRYFITRNVNIVLFVSRACLSRNKYILACNRTLYGDVGRTYRVEIRRPREDRLPFLCHLNFTAAGSDLGDLVQVGHRNDVVENNADWCAQRGSLLWEPTATRPVASESR